MKLTELKLLSATGCEGREDVKLEYNYTFTMELSVVFENSAHLPVWEEQEEYLARVREFVMGS